MMGYCLKVYSHHYFSAKQNLKGAVIGPLFCCCHEGDASCNDALAPKEEILVTDRVG